MATTDRARWEQHFTAVIMTGNRGEIGAATAGALAALRQGADDATAKQAGRDALRRYRATRTTLGGMDGERRLGVDIGRVIIGGAPAGGRGGADTSFFRGGLEGVVRTPPVAGVFEVLPGLVEQFGGRVWLVSKCGERVQQRTLVWLEHHRFHERTSIPRDHVRFCRARPDKAIHCAELGITDFVDDRLDVHAALRGVVAHRYLFGPQSRPVPVGTDGVIATPDWPAVAAALGS